MNLYRQIKRERESGEAAKREKVKPDVRWKNFWRQNDRFADLFNAVLFQRKAVLKPESLEEIDTDMSGIIKLQDYEKSLVRERDVAKKSAFGIEFVISALESRQRIHYAMPLRRADCNDRRNYGFLGTDSTGRE